jgi:hypothetical protein
LTQAALLTPRCAVAGAPVSKLLRYLAGVVLVGLLLEGACRHWGALFRAASHRSLFKAAMLEQRLPQDVVFFGTSRVGEAMRPHPFLNALGAAGAPPLTAFNVSTPYSSLEILQFVATHFSSAPGLKLAVIEISSQQLRRNPLPWAIETNPAADFDTRALGWIEERSALVRERKIFVLNSLSRLGLVLLFGPRFDGTEEFGTDYFAVIRGISQDFNPSRFHNVSCTPRPVDPPAGELAEHREERDIYAALAAEFARHGVKTAFLVPPSSDPEHSPENDPGSRAFRASLGAKTARPVWDFAECRLPADYFRDRLHLSHLGGSHFSQWVAQAAVADPEVAAALGLPAGKREANALQ